MQAVEGADYGAAVHGAKQALPAEKQAKDDMESKKRKLGWSIALLIVEMYISMYQMIYSYLGISVPNFIRTVFDGPENALAFAFTQLLLVLPITLLNKNYYVNGFKNLIARSPNMDSLVGVGSAAALLYGVVNIYYIGWCLGHGAYDLVTSAGTSTPSDRHLTFVDRKSVV